MPVLSNTIVFTLCAFSKASLFFISIPFLLDSPDAITIDKGVANPKLHGQATTKTDINTLIAHETSLFIAYHIIPDRTAIIIITGTNIPLILSAILAIGAFVEVASTTNFTISDTVEFLPIFSALYSIVPS